MAYVMKTNDPRWIPVLFALLYFGIAVFWPVHEDFWTRLIRLFLLSIAALCSLLVWVSYFVWARWKSRRTAGLFLTCLLVPAVICGIPAAVLSHRSKRLSELDARIKKESILITMQDEELVTDQGNAIGVRLLYQVRYPKGADALISHLPPANLSSAPAPYAAGFWISRTEIHALTATDYQMTIDIVPEFMPPALRFLASPKESGGGGNVPCFQWAGGPSSRTAALNAPAQEFRIYLSVPTYSGPTSRSYDLRRFYEGALKEGAQECSEQRR